MKFIFALLLLFLVTPTWTFTQDSTIGTKWSILKNGKGAERIRVARELSAYYQSESFDSLRVIGEILFFYGIDERYQPALEYGKITLSEYYVLHGRVTDGIGMAKDLIAPLQERGDFERLSEIYRIIASGYRILGDGNSSLLWAEKAINTSKNIQNNKEPFAGYPLLAEAYLLKNNTQKALEIYSNYIVDVSKAKNYRRLSSAYSRLGDIHRLNSNLKEAEKYFKLSYTAALKTNLSSPKTHALNNLAIIHFEKNDTLKAKEYFFKALEIREQVGDVKSITESYFNIGEYYFYTEQYVKARLWYEKSAKLAREKGLLKEEKDGVLGLANTAKAQSDFKDATNYLERALALGTQLKQTQIEDEEELTNLQYEIWKTKDLETAKQEKSSPFSYVSISLGIVCVFLIGLLIVLQMKHKKNAHLV